MIRRLIDSALGRWTEDILPPATADELAADLETAQEWWEAQLQVVREELDASEKARARLRQSLHDERRRHAETLRQLEDAQPFTPVRPETCQSLAECSRTRAMASKVSHVLDDDDLRDWLTDRAEFVIDALDAAGFVVVKRGTDA